MLVHTLIAALIANKKKKLTASPTKIATKEKSVERVNMLGRVLFVAVCLLFNVYFWYDALSVYLKSPKSFKNTHHEAHDGESWHHTSA